MSESDTTGADTDSTAIAEQFRIGVLGIGATGARAARQLASAGEVHEVVLGGPGERPGAMRRSIKDGAVVGDPLTLDVDAIVLSGPVGTHIGMAANAIDAGVHVVSTSDAIADVRGLLALHDRAVAAGVTVVAGAGFAPGMSDVLARHASAWVDTVEELHIARFGTGGPACARQHHDALGESALDWRDGQWVERTGGSGRELNVFPDPVGSLDCYRAALPDALLLHPSFPSASRITARQAANRRQRLTAWLPMLRKPHPEGRIGAIRVELRGWKDGASVNHVIGAIDRPAVAAGAVAGLAARWAAAGRFAPGASGLAALLDSVSGSGSPHVQGTPTTIEFLDGLAALGVRAAVFEGSN